MPNHEIVLSCDAVRVLCDVSLRRSRRTRARQLARRRLRAVCGLAVTLTVSLVVVGLSGDRAGAADPRPVTAPAVTRPALTTPAVTGVDAQQITSRFPYGTLIYLAAVRHDIDPLLLVALVSQESAFNARAVSSVGARGLTQLMPVTAAAVGVSDPYDPRQALDGGAVYLAEQLRRFGSVKLALAAYNAGPGNVVKYNGVPPYAETERYVRRVLTIRRDLRRQLI